jgi:hypothetical protein
MKMDKLVRRVTDCVRTLVLTFAVKDRASRTGELYMLVGIALAYAYSIV